MAGWWPGITMLRGHGAAEGYRAGEAATLALDPAFGPAPSRITVAGAHFSPGTGGQLSFDGSSDGMPASARTGRAASASPSPSRRQHPTVLTGLMRCPRWSAWEALPGNRARIGHLHGGHRRPGADSGADLGAHPARAPGCRPRRPPRRASALPTPGLTPAPTPAPTAPPTSARPPCSSEQEISPRVTAETAPRLPC